jgi:hypothetical protein
MLLYLQSSWAGNLLEPLLRYRNPARDGSYSSAGQFNHGTFGKTLTFSHPQAMDIPLSANKMITERVQRSKVKLKVVERLGG